MRLIICCFIGMASLWNDVSASVLRPKSSSQGMTPELTSRSNSSESTHIIPFLDPATSPMFGAPIHFDQRTINDMMQRIVGGSEATTTEAPFFTLLITWDESEGVWKNMGCGGAVVSNRHILTAAHCIAGRTGTTDAVFINAFDPFRGNPSIPYHFSKIKSFVVHPDFKDGTNVNDLAIITLKRRIKDTVSFPPVRLLHPDHSVVNGHETRVYGFGRRMENETVPVETLRAVTIPFISNEACKEYYPWSLRPDMICAGLPHGLVDSRAPHKDACEGDSGGPMTIIGDDDDLVYQMGIVSWGEGCGKSRKPGVYASVQYHYRWIQNAVCNKTVVADTVSSLCDVPLDAVTAFSSRTATSLCGETLKDTGSSCNYGGECCSGVCSGSSFYYKRVCQDEAKLRIPSLRKLRSRRAE